MHAGNLELWPIVVGAQSTLAKIMDEKLTKFPNFTQHFQKMPKLYIMFARIIFLRDFFFGGGATPCPHLIHLWLGPRPPPAKSGPVNNGSGWLRIFTAVHHPHYCIVAVSRFYVKTVPMTLGPYDISILPHYKYDIKSFIPRCMLQYIGQCLLSFDLSCCYVFMHVS